MSEATLIGETCSLSGRAWPERPGPQGQERGTVSEAAADRTAGALGGQAWPERPGPQGQERDT